MDGAHQDNLELRGLVDIVRHTVHLHPAPNLQLQNGFGIPRVEPSDVNGRSYLAWAWIRGRLRSARLDLGQTAPGHQEGSRTLSFRWEL